MVAGSNPVVPTYYPDFYSSTCISLLISMQVFNLVRMELRRVRDPRLRKERTLKGSMAAFFDFAVEFNYGNI